MKKFAILTSILALTACGGGSSNHGGGTAIAPGDIVTPSDTLTAEQRAAAIASNKEITGMESFIVVGGSNPTVNPNARTAAVKQPDGGTRYDLSNVRMHTTTLTEDFVNPDDGADILFTTKDGKVVQLQIVGPEQFGKDGLIGNRVNDTEIFSGTGIFTGEDEVRDDKGNLIGTETTTEELDFKLKFATFGKDVGLAYSEFGQIGVAADEDGEPAGGEFFAGGYQVKKIEPTNVGENKMNFTGNANGYVYTGDEDTMSGELNLTADASLEFVNGTSTLTANFDKATSADKWYQVVAKFDNNGTLSDMQFKNGENVDSKYKYHDKDEYQSKQTQHNENGSGNAIRNGFVEYYGDDNKPAEVVGSVKYVENEANKYEERIFFDMGFGAKRD